MLEQTMRNLWNYFFKSFKNFKIKLQFDQFKVKSCGMVFFLQNTGHLERKSCLRLYKMYNSVFGIFGAF